MLLSLLFDINLFYYCFSTSSIDFSDASYSVCSLK